MTAKRRRNGAANRIDNHKNANCNAPLRDNQTPIWQFAAISLLLAGVTIALYGSVSRHPFLNYDDPDYVTENQYIRSGLNWGTVRWALTATYAANWHPLTWVSHALDCQLYGLDPGGHHISNLILHVSNVLLLFFVFLRLTGATGRSTMVAALFALHPLNVESVAWVAERKNVLCTLFFLFALLNYVRYVRSGKWHHYIAVVVLFVLGLAAKPMVITLPFVLLLLDYWPLGRFDRWTEPSPRFAVRQLEWTRLIAEKLPLFALSIASAIITIFAQKTVQAVEPLSGLPVSMRTANAIYSYAMYVSKVVWPANLAVFYPHPMNTLSILQIGVSAAVLVTVSLLVWIRRSRCGYALVGWLWFIGTLVPVIGLMQVGAQGMADRYAYIPTIGIFVMIVWGFADLLGAVSFGARVAAPLALLALTACALLTYHQLAYWASPFDLWKHTLDVTQNNYIAEDGMAYVLLHQGRPEALHYYEAAAKMASWDPISHNAVAGNLQDHGRLREAIAEYGIALADSPHAGLAAHIYAELGVIYLEMGDIAQAQQNSLRSLQTDPDELPTMINQLASRLAQRPEAVGYFRLGLLLEGANRTADARHAYGRALELYPGFAPALRALRTVDAAGQKL